MQWELHYNRLFQPVSGRLEFKEGLNKTKIIDDTYNANRVSMRAALSVLKLASGPKVFVMGDMLELGQHAENWHRDIGEEAKRLGIDKMYGLGSLTKNAIEGFGEGAKHYTNKADLITDLKNSLKNGLKNSLEKGMTILVKGSRGMRMEEIVAALQNTDSIKDSIMENH